MDPTTVEQSSEISVVSNLVEPLLSRDIESGTLVPGAAERLSVSTDGLRLTFTLRKNLVWSNGQKITAHDFVYSFRRLLSPERRNWLSQKLSIVKGGEEMLGGGVLAASQIGIRAKDARTLVLELRKPSALILDLFAEPGMAPVHRETLERVKSGWTKPANWVGNGPFVPISFNEKRLILGKNRHHRWASVIAVDEVHVLWVQNAAVGTDRYIAGEVHQFGYRDSGVPLHRIPRLAGRSDLLFQPDLRTLFLRLNTVKAPLSQTSLRQALAMALDRPLLTASVALDGETEAFALIPEGIRRYDAPRGYLLNIFGAQKMLRNLGYCGKMKTSGNCKPFPLLTLIYPESQKKRKVALAVEAILKRNLGIDGISVVAKAPNEFVQLVKQGDFMIALDDLAVTPDRPFGFLDAFRAGKSTAGGFSSREFERQLKEADRSVEWKETRGYLRRAESTLLRDGGIVPLFHGSTAVLVSPKIKGYKPNIWDIHPYAQISVSK